MDRMKRRDVVVFGFAAAGSAAAQKAACLSYFARGLKERWKLSKDYSLAMLNKMPDQYLSYRPVPEVWTFSQQLTHLADANILMSAPLRGEKPDYLGEPKRLAERSWRIGFDRPKPDTDAEQIVQFFRRAPREARFMLPADGSCNTSPVAGDCVLAAEEDCAACICGLKRWKGIRNVSALCHHAHPSGLT
jgi:hypothetical protein